MLIRVTAVEVCDARDDDSSNAADTPVIFLIKQKPRTYNGTGFIFYFNLFFPAICTCIECLT